MSVTIESRRKYSLAEIDAMRRDISILMRSNHEHRYPGAVEDRLRTYMFNGTDPEELDKASADAWEKYQASEED